MRNPWNDDFARTNAGETGRKRPTFSLRTGLMIVLGNAAMMTAAHALAGGFGRALESTRDADRTVPIDDGKSAVQPVGALPRFARQTEPMMAWTVPQRSLVQIEIVELAMAPSWFASVAPRGRHASHEPPPRYTRATFRSHAASLSH